MMVASMRQPGSSVSPGSFSGNSALRTGNGDKAAGSGPIRYLSYSMEKIKPPSRGTTRQLGSYFIPSSASSPAWAQAMSFSTELPLTPKPPMSLPSTLTGKPPPKMMTLPPLVLSIPKSDSPG